MKKYIHYIIFCFSLIGFILFFPARFHQNSSCLGDQWRLMGEHRVQQHSFMEPNRMLHRYVFPFGVLWWASIAAGYWSFKNLRTL